MENQRSDSGNALAKDEDEAPPFVFVRARDLQTRRTRHEYTSCRVAASVVQQHCDAWLPMKRQIHLTILIDGILVVIDSNIGPSFPKRAKSSNERNDS